MDISFLFYLNIMKAVVLLIFGSARVVPPIKGINRGPAIMLGVNDTAKPIG